MCAAFAPPFVHAIIFQDVREIRRTRFPEKKQWNNHELYAESDCDYDYDDLW